MIHLRRIAVLCAVLLLPLVFTACDKLMPKKNVAGGGASAAADKSVPVEVLFSQARLKIELGKYDDAVDLLARANARKDAPASMQDWILFYLGLAEFLDNHAADARAHFAQLAERTEVDKEGAQLPKFFHDIAGRLSAEGLVPVDVISTYDRTSYEVLALYLCALKNENAGALTDAITFYRQFSTAPADGPEPFMGFNAQLIKLRQSATDICEYEELVEAATRARKAAAGSEEASAAAEAAVTARTRIKQTGKLLAALDDKLGDKTKAMAVDEDEDTKAFPPAKEQYYALLAKCDYGDARNAIFEPRLRSVKKQREQDLLAARAGYLEKFKFYLILEIGNTGYAQPVTLKDGTVVQGGIAKLEDKTVQIRDKGGVRAVSWSEISPESIFTMGKSLISPNEDADKAAFRKWHLGNYAAAVGKIDDARALMQEAVAANAQYNPEMAGLLELPAKP